MERVPYTLLFSAIVRFSQSPALASAAPNARVRGDSFGRRSACSEGAGRFRAMRRTVHAAAAQAAAATLSMAAVQRSMAAATWNQGPGTQLQGVVEEDEDSETETGGELRTAVEAREASRFAEEQEVHQTLSHFVVGSYTQKGSLHDNEDRFSAAIWGVDPECRRASAALPAEENASAAAAAATLAADKAKAKVAQMQNEAAILGLAAGARGLGFEERGMPTPLSPRKAAGAGGVSEGGGRPQQQVLSWRGRRCVVVPPLLSDFRLAVVDPEVAGLALLEETAREAARAAANTATQTAAAVEAVLDLLVTAPPVPAMKPPAPSGPLLAALRLRRSSGGGEVEWLGVSAAWEPSLRRRRDASAADRAEKAQPAAPAAGEAGAETRSLAQVRRERLPTLVLCVCDGHDNHEAAEFVAKALPLMAYRRLPQQLALVHAEHLHAAARSLFADVEVLLRWGACQEAKLQGSGGFAAASRLEKRRQDCVWHARLLRAGGEPARCVATRPPDRQAARASWLP